MNQLNRKGVIEHVLFFIVKYATARGDSDTFYVRKKKKKKKKLTNCNCSLWEETIGWQYWYTLCYSYWPIITLLCEKRQLVGNTDTPSRLQLLTNSYFALWEKTISWWFWCLPCYSQRPIVSVLCEKRQLVGDTDTLYVTVSDQLSLRSVRKDNWVVSDTDTFYVTVTDQLSLLFVRRDNWLVILILSVL